MRACLLVLLFALPATAQLTVPASYTNGPASSWTAYPYGYSGAIRVQVLYAASETGLAGPALLRGLELRANPVSTNAAKTGIDLELSLSASPFTRTTMTNTYATNHGPNLTVVHTRKIVSAAATQPDFLGQGSGMVLFDRPFLYDPAAGSLLVDFDVATQPTGAWSIQTASSSPTNGKHSDIGTGCQGLDLTSAGGGSANTLSWTLTSGQPNAPGLFLIGLNLLPAALPIPGSPGCNLYQDLFVHLAVQLSPTGGWSLPLSWAPNPQVRGLTLFGQMAILNPTNNQVHTSQCRAITLTNAHDGGRLYSLGSNTTPTGSLQLGSMIVIRFQN